MRPPKAPTCSPGAHRGLPSQASSRLVSQTDRRPFSAEQGTSFRTQHLEFCTTSLSVSCLSRKRHPTPGVELLLDVVYHGLEASERTELSDRAWTTVSEIDGDAKDKYVTLSSTEKGWRFVEMYQGRKGEWLARNRELTAFPCWRKAGTI